MLLHRCSSPSDFLTFHRRLTWQRTPTRAEMTNLPLPLLSITANEDLTSVNLYSHWSNKDREKEKKKIHLSDISTSLPPSTPDAMEGFSLVEHADDGQIPPDSLIQEVDKTEKKKGNTSRINVRKRNHLKVSVCDHLPSKVTRRRSCSSRNNRNGEDDDDGSRRCGGPFLVRLRAQRSTRRAEERRIQELRATSRRGRWSRSR